MSRAGSTVGGAAMTAKQMETVAVSMRDTEVPWNVQAKLHGFKIDDDQLPRRNALCPLGKPILVKSNIWQTRNEKLKTARFQIHQYDIEMTDGKNLEPGLRKVKEKAWYSRAINSKIGNGFMYDGNKLGWCLRKLEHMTVEVDLNVEEGRDPAPKDSKNYIKVRIQHAKVVNMAPLVGMLEGKDASNAPSNGSRVDNANHDLAWSEALNVLEHVHHQNPRSTKNHFRKAFFTKQQNDNARENLGEGVQAAKGVFVSLRATLLGYNNGLPSRCLSYNVDISNCAFWIPGKLTDLLRFYFEGMNARDEHAILQELERAMGQANRRGGSEYNRQHAFYDTRAGRILAKLKRVKFTASHISKKGVKDKEYCIADIVPLVPTEASFEKDGKKITVANHFWETYKIRLGKFPIIRTTTNSFFPMDTAYIIPDQRFSYKLNEKQVSKMLGFAVQIPRDRWQAIEGGVRSLGWGNDPWMKEYGIQVKPTAMDDLSARLLPTPDIHFKLDKDKVSSGDGVKGRWRIDGKKFRLTNNDVGRVPNCWGIVVATGGRFSLKPDEIVRWHKEFTRVYGSHGGQFKGPPFMWSGALMGNPSAYESIVKGCVAHGQKNGSKKQTPDFLFFVVPDRNADVYKDIKRNCELRFGIASQVMQSSHVQKCQGQYISNICLKVNAKLGGATCQAITQATKASTEKFYAPASKLMIMGADVTHGSAGGTDPSVAALTMSMDTNFNRYFAAVESNGYRQEMIQTVALKSMFTKMVNKWAPKHGGLPQHVLYMRDGVSTEQCFKVLAEEVRDLKAVMKDLMTARGQADYKPPPFTVLICTKRHHVRIFPKDGDRNGNSLPGTMLETGATLATDVDWYMNSHVALKGTARPMHYIMILNENKFPLPALQQFTYENCLQYCRATTPISQFPAIAYAHLAAARGKLHVNASAAMSEKKAIEERLVEGQKAGKVLDQAMAKRVAEREAQMAQPMALLKMQPSLLETMWFA